MMQSLFIVLCAAGVIGSALVAGIFMAFSDFGMKSLGSVTPASGIESMQAINRDVYGSIFVKLLLGVAPFAVFLSTFGYLYSTPAASIWLAAGTTIYLLGVIFITLRFNVPMNQKLDVLDHTSEAAATYWSFYLTEWTRWNHFRTVASGVSAICFLMACIEVTQGMSS